MSGSANGNWHASSNGGPDLPLDPATSRGRCSRSSGRRCCRRPRSPIPPCSTGRSSTSSPAGSASVTSPPSPSRARYLMREIGATSVFAMRGRGRRGARLPQRLPPSRRSRIVTETEGQVRKRIQCPYHAWSYDLEGKLVAAPHMDEVEDFDRSCCGLLEVRSAVVGGLLLIDLSGVAPDPAEPRRRARSSSSSATASPELRRARRHRLRGRGELEGDRRELQRVPALPRRPPGAERAQRLPQRRGGLRRGRLVRRLDDAERGRRDDGHRRRPRRHRPPIAGLTPKDIDSVYYFALFPNALVSLHPDYFMLHTLWPRAAGAPRSPASGSSSPRRSRRDGFDPARRGRVLGHGQQAGLVRLRADPARRRRPRLHGRPLRRRRSRRARLRPDGRRADTWKPCKQRW